MASIPSHQSLKSTDADFIFQVTAQRGIGRATRGFAATDAFINACGELNRALLPSLVATMQTVVVLEEVEAGSVMTWLRYSLGTGGETESQATDWKRIVSNYLVRSTSAVARWIGESGGGASLAEMAEDLRQIADETGLAGLDIYQQPCLADLAAAAGRINAVGAQLLPVDKAVLLTSDGNIELDVSARLSSAQLERLAVAQTVVSGPVEMILTVEEPDYRGGKIWRLGHGGEVLNARIEDSEWLRRFTSRELNVRPGDGLRVHALVELDYGADNELVARRYTIHSISDMLVPMAAAG